MLCNNHFFLRAKNMAINICFIIYPWERIDPEEDSSLSLVHEIFVLNHNVGIIYSHELSIRESITYDFVRRKR